MKELLELIKSGVTFGNEKTNNFIKFIFRVCFTIISVGLAVQIATGQVDVLSTQLGGVFGSLFDHLPSAGLDFLNLGGGEAAAQPAPVTPAPADDVPGAPVL